LNPAGEILKAVVSLSVKNDDVCAIGSGPDREPKQWGVIKIVNNEEHIEYYLLDTVIEWQELGPKSC
jgi:hypothetical protein